MLQDMILAAVNGALKLADDKTSQAMAKLNGGLPGFPACSEQRMVTGPEPCVPGWIIDGNETEKSLS